MPKKTASHTSDDEEFTVQLKEVGCAIVDVVCGLIVYAHSTAEEHVDPIYKAVEVLVDESIKLAEL